MKRLLRLSFFGVAVLLVSLIVLNFGLAWIMVSAMTHPICLPPTYLEDIPAPGEYWLETEDGISIRIWYYPSQNGAAILTFGGMNGSLGDRLPQAENLIRAGFGIVQVDSRACGQPSAPVTQGHDELFDAEAAIKFVLGRPEIDPERIGSMGFSMGGATALRVAARHPEIRAVARDGGFSNLGDLLSPKRGQSIPEYIQKTSILMLYRLRSGIDPEAVDCLADLAAINPRPVLLIYGEQEAAAGREQIETGSENVELWIVPNGSHGNNHRVASEEYSQRVLNFFNRTLSE